MAFGASNGRGVLLQTCPGQIRHQQRAPTDIKQPGLTSKKGRKRPTLGPNRTWRLSARVQQAQQGRSSARYPRIDGGGWHRS